MAESFDLRRGPQLKTTCDACHAAKVKCSQAHPTCARCESRRVHCQYSISLRSLKQATPQPSVSTRGPSSVSTTTNTSNHASPEHFAPSSIAPSSATSMSEQFSLSYNPQLSPFDDVSFVSSPSLDSWAADFIGSGGSTLYADPTDDARVLPSQRSSTDLDPAFRVDYPDKPGRHPANSHDGNLQSTDPPGTTCACQQNILSKLSDISATSRLAHSNPFDTSLAENKNIIALCAFIVDCPNKQHDQDIALMLTGLALITHVIAVYDHRLRASYTDRDSDCAVAHFTLNHLTEVDFNQSSALTNREVLGQQPHRTKPFANVRLRLGSYQLDLKDEAMLQSSLLRIELSKIGTLIASFERRFCTFDYQNATGPLRNEPKPLGEVIAHLKKRLKVNYECLASF